MPRLGHPSSPRALALVLLGVSLGGAACDEHVNLGSLGDGGRTVLWTGTFEPGDFSEWTSDGNGGMFQENAPVLPVVSQDVAHNGHNAGKFSVKPTTVPSTSFLFRDLPSPQEGYYSVWVYIPSTLTVRMFLSVMHFRGSQTGDGRTAYALWDLNLNPPATVTGMPAPPNTLTAQLYDFRTGGIGNVFQLTGKPVPRDAWVHFELLFVKATTATGHISVWQDDSLVLDKDGITTVQNDWLEWSVGGASNGLDPSPGVVYVDDAAISVARIADMPLPLLGSPR